MNNSLPSDGKSSHKGKCFFCYKTDHYSDQCQIFTDLEARRKILKKKRICFKCLKHGHTKPNRNVINVIKCHQIEMS